MKTIYLIIIGLLICVPVSSYSQDYFKFPEHNSIWNYKFYGSYIAPHEWSVIDSLGNVITIDDKEYTELYTIGKHVSTLTGAIRQDTLSRKVYFHNFSDEIVLYDFTLKQGDTIHYTTNGDYSFTYYKVVDSLSIISVNNQNRKVWHLTNSYLSKADTWIEGIGSVTGIGLLNPNQPLVSEDGSTPYFGCFKYNNVVFTNQSTCNQTCPCTQWFVGVPDPLVVKQSIKVYPNPFYHSFIIEQFQNNYSITSIDIISSNGTIIYNEKFDKTGMVEIYPGNIPKGIYYLKIIGENQIFNHIIVK